MGTLVQVLSVDVVARFYRLKGEDVAMVSGSDEHGTPIEVEAVRRGISHKQLTDKNYGKSLSYSGDGVLPLIIALGQRMLEKSCISLSEPVKF